VAASVYNQICCVIRDSEVYELNIENRRKIILSIKYRKYKKNDFIDKI
jgi:hypothetical protein